MPIIYLKPELPLHSRVRLTVDLLRGALPAGSIGIIVRQHGIAMPKAPTWQWYLVEFPDDPGPYNRYLLSDTDIEPVD